MCSLIRNPQSAIRSRMVHVFAPAWRPAFVTASVMIRYAATSTAAGEALFGGGVTAERYYEKGESNIQISIFSDSPLMQSMMMMLSNPMLATSDGGKMIKVSGHKAILNYDDEERSGDIDIVLASKYLIQLSGYMVDKEDLMSYAEAIDFDKLESMK